MDSRFFQSITNELRILRGTSMISMQTKRIDLDNPTRELDSLLHKVNRMQSHLFRRLDDRIGLFA